MKHLRLEDPIDVLAVRLQHAHSPIGALVSVIAGIGPGPHMGQWVLQAVGAIALTGRQIPFFPTP